MVHLGPLGPNEGEPTRALVLSGGGSRGALQVGMAKRLFENGLRPHIVTGVSVGALNGFFLAQHKPDELEAMWRSIKGSSDVFRTRWLGIPLSLFGLQWGYPSLYAPGPIRKLIRKQVRQCPASGFHAMLRVGAVDLKTGEYMMVDQTCPQLGRMLAGSMSIPLAFPPVPINRGPGFIRRLLRRKRRDCVDGDGDHNGLFVDGDVRGRTPIGEAIAAGADEIHVLLCTGLDIGHDSSEFNSFVQIIQRTVSIILHDKLIDDVKDVLVRNELVDAVRSAGNTCKYRPIKIYVYEPQDAQLQGLLDFDPQAISDCIDIGYALAEHPWTNDTLDGWLRKV